MPIGIADKEGVFLCFLLNQHNFLQEGVAEFRRPVGAYEPMDNMYRGCTPACNPLPRRGLVAVVKGEKVKRLRDPFQTFPFARHLQSSDACVVYRSKKGQGIHPPFKGGKGWVLKWLTG